MGKLTWSGVLQSDKIFGLRKYVEDGQGSADGTQTTAQGNKQTAHKSK
jgi:hypothetical protein